MSIYLPLWSPSSTEFRLVSWTVLGLLSPGTLQLSCERCGMHKYLTHCHTAHADVARVIRNLKLLHLWSEVIAVSEALGHWVSLNSTHPSQPSYFPVPQWVSISCFLVPQLTIVLISVITFIAHLLSQLFVCLSPSLAYKFLEVGLGFFHIPYRVYTKRLGI